MKKLFFFFIFLFCFSSVNAFSCDSLSKNKDYCEVILDADISDEEKDLLLADILDDLKVTPSHEFVRSSNLNLPRQVRPSDTEMHEEGVIKNAWVKALAVMPSVYEDGYLYSPGIGEFLSAYDYQVVLPSSEASGDCKTNYQLMGEKVEVRTYANGKQVGNDTLSSFNVSGDVHLEVEIEITVYTEVDHFKEKKKCLRKRRGKCVDYERTCKFKKTEEKKDRLTIKDSFYATYYDPYLNASLTVEDKYTSTSQVDLNTTDFTASTLLFAESYYKEHNYEYTVGWTYEPLYVLTVVATPFYSREHSNLVIQNATSKEFLVKNTDECEVILYDHFEGTTFPCDLQFNNEKFDIRTDKSTYYPEENIHISIKPSNKPVLLTYANNTYNVTGHIILKAVKNHNKITLKSSQRTLHKLIHVKDQQTFSFFFYFIIFVGLNYTIIKVVKGLWGEIAYV